MKRNIQSAQTQSAALIAALVLLVMGSGVSLLHAFTKIVS
jgi:hypothetical protein